MAMRALTWLMSGLLGLGARFLFSIHDGVLRFVFGRPPAEAEGLAPDAWAVGRVVNVLDRGPKAVQVSQMRFETDLLSSAVADPRPRGLEIRDLELDPAGRGGPLRARLYRPLAAPSTGPLMLFFHGGGWTVGSIRSHDRPCALLACRSGVKILSVEYRLAPEYPFPAAADDALRSWKAVTSDPTRFGAEIGQIAVGGDSAGGNLAAVLCQDLKAQGLEQPTLQLLIYPVLEVGSTRPSMGLFSEGYYLTAERMSRFSGLYVSPDQYSDLRASPLLNADLSGLAPAWILNCLADPLRDEGEAYADRLAEAGVEVRSDRLPLIHAWFNMTRSRSARQAHRLLAAGLNRFMRESGPLSEGD